MDHVWELRNPEGGMLGQEWARCVCEATDVLLAHTLPSSVDVVVRDEDDQVVARGSGLEATEQTPMARLRIVGGEVLREQVWPDEQDVGRPVVLPGGEVGVLRSWWNADDRSEWRWQLELHNRAD